MPNYFARKAGNIDATDVWATTPAGTAGPVTFVAGDVLYANSFSITVNVSTNLGSTGEVRTDNTNGASNGGTFILSNGVTLTANVFTVGGGYGGALSCVTFSGTTGNSASLVGNVIGGGSTNCFGANNTSSGTLNITGNCTGGLATEGARNSSNGTINIVGNCIGGSQTGGNIHGANNASSGTINITGNCIGGGMSGAGNGFGAINSSTGTINIVGNCIGGSGVSSGNIGAVNNSTGILSITGNCTGSSASAAVGASNASTGQMSVNGSIFASEFAPGVGGGARGQVTSLTGPFYTSPIFGVNPNTCLAWRWAATLNPNTFIQVPTTNLTSLRNFVTPDNATNFPSGSNVRAGITYGISGALVGTCVIPPSGAVAFGVPVDSGVGSATLNPADMWNYNLNNLNVSGSIGSRLRNSATISSVGDQIAAF